MRFSTIVILETLGIFIAPSSALALSLSKAFGYLDIFVGLFLTASIIMFAGALLVYFTRYGTPRRADAFPFMEGAIAIVFVLIVLLALVHYFQKHTNAALYVLGVILFILLAKLLMSVIGSKKAKAPAGPPGSPPVVRP